MKKYILLFVLSLFFLVGCATKADTQLVSLEGNATTGYRWICIIEDENVVALKSNDYVVNDSPAGMVGVGGHWDFVLSPVGDGSTSVTFLYKRSWEQSEIEKVVYIAEVKNGKLLLFK